MCQLLVGPSAVNIVLSSESQVSCDVKGNLLASFYLLPEVCFAQYKRATQT